jgi:hypothetical protein
VPGTFTGNISFRVTGQQFARRTLIPAAGGTFDTTITSTVGRGVGQISTYNVSVPPGRSDIDVSFTTPDASPDNRLTYFLINPSGTVVAEDATPTQPVSYVWLRHVGEGPRPADVDPGG